MCHLVDRTHADSEQSLESTEGSTQAIEVVFFGLNMIIPLISQQMMNVSWFERRTCY